MVNYLDDLFESIVKDVDKKSKLLESKRNSTSLKEAKMSEIPHEIDDVVHGLAQSRVDMEHLRKTWESAGFSDLTPLDDIIKGLVDLTTLVYNKGALLSDQIVGSEAKPLVPLATPATEGSDNALKEDDGNETEGEDSGEGEEDPEEYESQAEEAAEEAGEDIQIPDVESSTPEDLASQIDEATDNSQNASQLEDKEITLAECEALCANPLNASLRKAFKKCCSDFRHNKPEGSNGEIVKIILTPRNNLRLHFDGCDRPAFAYCDGESCI